VSIDSQVSLHSDTETYNSPFGGLSELAEPEASSEEVHPGWAESPFEAAYFNESPFAQEIDSEADQESAAFQDLLQALHDEDFEDALEAVMNEGAARALADAQQWSAPPSEGEMREAIESWISPLVTGWERAVDGLTAGLEHADFGEIVDHELDELLDSLDTPAGLGSEVFDNFLGSLIRKAKAVVRSTVRRAKAFVKNPVKGVIDIAKTGLKTIKSGVEAAGKFVLQKVLAGVKKAGSAFLKGVIKMLSQPLMRVLPASVRPLAQILMKRFGIGEIAEASAFTESNDEVGTAAALAEALDREFAALAFATETDHELAAEVEEVGAEHAESGQDLVSELDDARARLAAQLSEYNGPGAPIAEIEQFVPAVLAIRPLLKLGLKITGAREKLINLIASPLANLIKKMVGADAMKSITTVAGQEPAKMIARGVVDVGFTALGLETAPIHDEAVSGEAIASAVEATVSRVVDEVTDEALSDPLQMNALVQRAFAESAAAYLPDRLLRADLAERETANEGGFWVLMPRTTRPRYKFRKYSRAFVVPITRQVARAVPWSDGGTLETYLLDRGAETWPVQAEVDLYETMPGTFPGHFTRDETLPAEEKPTADEYQPLTEEVAGALLGEPKLGRGRHRPHPRPGGYRPGHGQRYFRVRVGRMPARRVRRPRRMVSVHFDPTAKRLAIMIRLSERRGRSLQARLQRSAPAGQRDLPAVLAVLRDIAMPRLQYRVARQLLKSSLVADPVVATEIAGSIAAATSTGIATYLVKAGAQLAAAVADPADGVTIAVTFDGLTGTPGQVPRPEVVAKPGMG
jgi:hypothetical protein